MKRFLLFFLLLCAFLFAIAYPAASASPTKSLNDIPHYNSIDSFLYKLDHPSFQQDPPILTYASSGVQIAESHSEYAFIPFARSTTVILQDKTQWSSDSINRLSELKQAPSPVHLIGFFEPDGVVIRESLSRYEQAETSNRQDMYHFLRTLHNGPGLITKDLKVTDNNPPAAIITTDLIAEQIKKPSQHIIFPKDNQSAIEIGYLVPKKAKKDWETLIHSSAFKQMLRSLGLYYNNEIDRFVTDDAIASLPVTNDFKDYYADLPHQQNLYRLHVLHIFSLYPSSSAESFVFIGLFIFICFIWNISIYNRFAEGALRNYFFVIGCMLILILLLRLLKSQDFTDLQKVYIWYLYYVPRLIALGVWLRATYELTEKKYLRPQLFYGVYAFIALMLTLILTNNRHQLVFRFNGEPSYINYTYGPFFYVTLIGFALIFIMSCIFVALASKTAIYRKRQMYVAIGYLTFVLLYSILYITGMPYISVTSPSIIWVIATFIFIECYCRFGFSYINLYTAPFWENSNLQLRIYDVKNRCIYSSTNEEESGGYNIHYYYHTKDRQRIIINRRYQRIGTIGTATAYDTRTLVPLPSFLTGRRKNASSVTANCI